jgi:translation initiation factor 3 subunit H
VQSNFDNYHVGAYHVSYMGYFYVDSLVEELSGFFRNEELSKNSIALLYDPIQTTRGSIFLKAFRVSSRYRDAGNEFIPPSDILEELPVKITCNALATAFVRCLRDSHSQAFDNDFQRFEVSAADDVLLMRHLEELAAGTDELVRTQSEFQRYAKDKSVAKQRKELIELMLKRKKQNEEYQMDGKDPLPAIPTELYERPLPDAPPRLYTLLATAQLGQYCDQTEQHVEDSFHKLFATRALHTSQPAPSAEI